MKKIQSFVYVSDADLTSYRANAIHVMKICRAFAEICESVTLFCGNKGESLDIYEQYGVPKSFHILSSLCKNYSWLPGALYGILSGFLNARKINKHYKDAYVYGRSIWTLYFLDNDRKFSYEVHSIPNKKLYEIIESILVNRKGFDQLVTISKPLQLEYIKRYPKLSGKIHILHDGADIVAHDVKKAPLDTVDKSEVHIGYVGSLYPGKCMETLLPIASKMPDLFFHIVGGSQELVESWKSKCENKSINNIIFYGSVRPSEVNNYYQAFDVILLPYSNNIYYRKGKTDDIGKWISPLKLFEAMSNGKAIVVTSLGSISEILDNNEDAILIEADAVDTWCNAIRNLIVNRDMRERLGKNALSKFESTYTWRKRAEQIVSLCCV